jgi:hypothetical protein
VELQYAFAELAIRWNTGTTFTVSLQGYLTGWPHDNNAEVLPNCILRRVGSDAIRDRAYQIGERCKAESASESRKLLTQAV